MFLIVMGYDRSVVHFRAYASREEAEGAACYWYHVTDSEGRRKYRVFLSQEEYGVTR